MFSQNISSKKLATEKQTINVSLVSKSSISIHSKKKFDSQAILDKNINNSLSKVMSSKLTSGKTDDKATAINSADILPIFNAKHLNNPAPIYPEIARQRGVEGEVVIKVLVSSKGKALKVDIIKSSGSAMLDLSALETIKTWQFIPAKQDDNAVESSVLVPIVFKII